MVMLIKWPTKCSFIISTLNLFVTGYLFRKPEAY